MLIINITSISFKIPDEMEKERRFRESTEDINEWVKSETSQFITYKKTTRYSVEGGVINPEQIH